MDATHPRHAIMRHADDDDEVDTYAQGKRQTNCLVPQPTAGIALSKVFHGSVHNFAAGPRFVGVRY